ncbi:MAG: protease modulator HflC [Gammaproteobacteria bacterium]
MNRAYLVAIAIVAVLVSMSLFVVDERQRAIKLQLGRVERSDYDPGLHFKWPLVENIIKFDARVQTLDTDPQLYLTVEKKNVIVDSFVKWRVKEPETFYTSTGGDLQRANDRLGVVVLKRLRDEFGKRTIFQVVSGERGEIMQQLKVSAQDQADRLGLEIVDVRVKRVDLPQDVSQSVYDRMKAERQEVAQRFRSEGEEQARQIRAEANKDVEVIIAEANREAQKLRGEGDAKATNIYADAFSRDAEFYSLYRSLDAYRNTFNKDSDVLLIEPNTQFFRYFKDSKGGISP